MNTIFVNISIIVWSKIFQTFYVYMHSYLYICITFTIDISNFFHIFICMFISILEIQIIENF